MPSPLFVGMTAQIEKLDAHFIVHKSDYSEYNDSDHAHALAFTMLASAELETYAEKRCEQIAAVGVERLRAGKESGTGRALMMWHVVRRSNTGFPVHERDIYSLLPLSDDALFAYDQMVRSSHGIDAKDLHKLVYPIGLRDTGMPVALGVNLGTLAERRNPASHSHVNRARSLRDPREERDLVNSILTDLEEVDAALEAAVMHYPIP